MISPEIIDRFRVPPETRIRLKDYDPGWAQTADLEEAGKDAVRQRALEVLQESLDELTVAQELLWASDTYSILIVLQAMDAAGKDGIVKHVMSGLNPQGCEVTSFKRPSDEELDHNFLWRCWRRLPGRGKIGIFNRSYYEEVLVAKVHPAIIAAQKLPKSTITKRFWKRRYQDINAFERHLVRNGTIVLKFFLYISKDEQKKRFLDRLENPDKHWKFSAADLAERAYWNDYMRAFEDALSATSTRWAPWYVVPSNHKWASRAIVADILTTTITSLGLEYPKLQPEQEQELTAARQQLLDE